VNELPLSVFKHAIKARYRSNSFLIRRAKIEARLDANARWDGEVLVFLLPDFSPRALCYAWSLDAFVSCFLHEPPIDSPMAAVLASIAASSERREETRRIG
jgi:hypothetical protein